MTEFHKICAWCGNDFTYTSSHGGASKYCSPECSRAAKLEQTRIWKKAHPDRVRQHRGRYIKRRYYDGYSLQGRIERNVPKFIRPKVKTAFKHFDISNTPPEKLPDVINGILSGDLTYSGITHDIE